MGVGYLPILRIFLTTLAEQSPSRLCFCSELFNLGKEWTDFTFLCYPVPFLSYNEKSLLNAWDGKCVYKKNLRI